MNGTSHQILSLNDTNSTWIEAVTEDENEEAAEPAMSINRMISYYGEGILLTAVSIFGLIGNLMSIVVLTRSINSRGCHDNRQVLKKLSDAKITCKIMGHLMYLDANTYAALFLSALLLGSL